MRVVVRLLATFAVLVAVLALVFAFSGRFQSVGYVGTGIAIAAAVYGILEWRRALLSPSLAALLLVVALGISLTRLRYDMVNSKRSHSTQINRDLEIIQEAEHKSP
jgi:hypothetical protein